VQGQAQTDEALVQSQRVPGPVPEEQRAQPVLALLQALAQQPPERAASPRVSAALGPQEVPARLPVPQSLEARGELSPRRLLGWNSSAFFSQ
jgi:hypothetical protein